MKLHASILPAGALAILLSSAACADPNPAPEPPAATADTTTAAPGPVLAELFTSQSCSSCPPAESFFSELAGRDGLVTIEWHVDYWDDLAYGRAGRWKDPYSDPDNTERQRRYNLGLRETRAVYTPQAIINGSDEMVGSHRGDVSEAIEDASPTDTRIAVTRAGGELFVNVEGSGAASDVTYVRLLPQQETDVQGGENNGKELASRNLALASQSLGTWSGQGADSFTASVPEADETCAIIVQEKSGSRTLGPVLAASYCPDPAA